MPDIGLLLAERGGPNASPGFPYISVSYGVMFEYSLWMLVPNSAFPRWQMVHDCAWTYPFEFYRNSEHSHCDWLLSWLGYQTRRKMTEVSHSDWHEKFRYSVPASLQGFPRIEGRIFLRNVESWSESRFVGL